MLRSDLLTVRITPRLAFEPLWFSRQVVIASAACSSSLSCRSVAEKEGDCLPKGGGSTTAWTFGLLSSSDAAEPDQPQSRRSITVSSSPSLSSTSVLVKGKGKAASVAPSPELLHRSFVTPVTTTSTSSTRRPPAIPSLLNRNERRTRSLERCFHQRVFSANSNSVTASCAAVSLQPPSRQAPPAVPPRIRSRSLEKNHQFSTIGSCRTGNGSNNHHFTSPVVSSSATALLLNSLNCGAGGPPPPPASLLLPGRRAQVPPEVLATWCTFNEAFGGSRPKQSLLAEPAALLTDERDSPGSPVFEELFLPPPNKFAGNDNNKRNSLAGSCSHSSKSTPRSSPVPLLPLAPPSSPPSPPPPSHPAPSHPAVVVASAAASGAQQPETVLYGTREAPVLERHCVEGGEFIIAWLSHSSALPAGRQSSSGDMPHSQQQQQPGQQQQQHQQQSSSSVNPAGMNSTAGCGNGGGSGGGSNRSFINKPARGWLHSDQVIVREGITYFVRVRDETLAFHLLSLFTRDGTSGVGWRRQKGIDPRDQCGEWADRVGG